MITLYNIIGCIFLGLMAYFLWSIDGWLWLKAIIAFVVGLIFIAAAKSMQKDKQDDDEWLEYIDKLEKENAYDKIYEQKLADYAAWTKDKDVWTKETNDD